MPTPPRQEPRDGLRRSLGVDLRKRGGRIPSCLPELPDYAKDVLAVVYSGVMPPLKR